MNFNRRHHHDLPELNTSSLPDLIFTVLFFFMIVTHMRQHAVGLDVAEPQGTNVSQLAHKRDVIPLYVGHLSGQSDASSAQYAVQLDDRLVPIDGLEALLADELSYYLPAERERLVVSMKIDGHVPMRIVNDVKTTLRRHGLLNVSYAATPDTAVESIRKR